MTRLFVIIWQSVFMLTIAILAACASGAAMSAAPEPTTAPTVAMEATAAPPTATLPPHTGKVLFKLVRADGSAMDFTTDMLKALPQGMVMLGSTPDEGPPLTDILKAAGVMKFTEITITGSRGSVTFTQAELTSKYLLDFTNRGTLKPAWPNAPQPTQVGDVSLITVK